jgi:hypothetical protein
MARMSAWWLSFFTSEQSFFASEQRLTSQEAMQAHSFGRKTRSDSVA